VCSSDLTFGEDQAALSQRLLKSGARIRDGPTFLHQSFQVTRALANALGLLPFCQSEIARVTLGAIHKPARHLPVVFQIEFPRDVTELVLEVGQVHRRHAFRINAAPNCVRMPSAFLLVKDDDARMTAQPNLHFNAVCGIFKGFDPDILGFRGIKGDGEQELTATRALTHGISLFQCAYDVIRDEAAYLVHLDMLVLFGFQEVQTELFGSAAL